MTDISPAAQAVMDAYRSLYKSTWLDEPMDIDVACLADALRAAANCLTDATSAHTLYAIANELEGSND